jgi:hypothetical protein
MDTPSFLDRLRRTGVISPGAAAVHGALGPVGRASGLAEDVRSARPYGAYTWRDSRSGWRRSRPPSTSLARRSTGSAHRTGTPSGATSRRSATESASVGRRRRKASSSTSSNPKRAVSSG